MIECISSLIYLTRHGDLLGLLERVLALANEVAGEPLEPLSGLRRRPSRLSESPARKRIRILQHSRENRVSTTVTPDHIMQVGMGFWASKTRSAKPTLPTKACTPAISAN